MDLETELFQLIRKERLIEPGERVLVGVSGGIDSTTLLHLLAALRQRIPHELALAHVNHLLRADEAERDETFVRDLGMRLSMPVHVRRVDVKTEAKASGRSVQHTGRDVRYAYFEALAVEFAYDRVAIAHNLDDQVETFILRMVKGTGIRGLSAIPIKREKSSGRCSTLRGRRLRHTLVEAASRGSTTRRIRASYTSGTTYATASSRCLKRSTPGSGRGWSHSWPTSPPSIPASGMRRRVLSGPGQGKKKVTSFCRSSISRPWKGRCATGSLRLCWPAWCLPSSRSGSMSS